MEKQRTSPRKKNTAKPASESEHYGSDDDNTGFVKDANRAKRRTRQTRDKKVKTYAESSASHSSSEEERSPSKKIKSHRDSSASHSSSYEKDSLPAKNRNTESTANQASEESNSDATEGQSKKEKVSEMRKTSCYSDTVKISPSKTKNDKAAKNIPDKPLNTDAAFSDHESSEGLPDIEKAFEILEEESAREERTSNLKVVIKISPQKKDDGTKSAQQKNDKTGSVQKKTTSPGKKSELNDHSPSKDKKSEHSHPKHDKSSNSTSKENDSAVPKAVENNKANTLLSDREVKKAGRGRPKKAISNSSSDKTSSANVDNTSSKGKKNLTEKQTISDSGAKKPGRGRHRKSELPADPEKNGKLLSKDDSNSEAESTLSGSKGNKLKKNESRRQSKKKTDIEIENTVEETTSNPQDKSTANAESPSVFAVKSKPSTKRKNDEVQKKSKKHSNVKKSSPADNEADTGPVSDKNNSFTSKRKPRDSGEIKSTITTDEKGKTICTSSDDSTDSEETFSRTSLAAKDKERKLKYSCHKCNTKFNRTQQLFDHICEGKRDKGFACESCDKIYKLRSTYINHKFIHSRKKPYKCGICGKKSVSQSNHLHHMKNFHPERKPFPCELAPCEKSFMTRSEQSAHHKEHKRFVCTYCDEVFAKNSTLLRHKYKVHEMYFS